MEKMKTVLSVKEESLRSQHQARSRASRSHREGASCSTDEPQRQMIQSRILLEKTRLEEEKHLRLRITELESLVTCQQEETKWKNRAISRKGKSKAQQDRPTSPCTPKKRVLQTRTAICWTANKLLSS